MTLLSVSTLDWVLWWAVLAVSVLASAMYSGLETGLYVLNKIRLDLQAESGSRGARVLRVLLRRFDQTLIVLLVGTNVSNYAATFALSALFVLGGHGEHAEWYSLAAGAPLLFVFGESIPKNLFQRFTEPLVYRLVWLLRASDAVFRYTGIAPLVRWVSQVLFPGRGPGQALAHEGLAAIVAESVAVGAMTHAQSVMADRVIHLTTVRIADVMQPLRKVVAAGPDATAAELIQLTKEHNFSRLPIVGEGARIIGVIDIFDVLIATGPINPRHLMTQPVCLSDSLTVTDALYHMQHSHASMAVVTDSTGRHVGIVTIKDLVEEIVGELGAW